MLSEKKIKPENLIIFIKILLIYLGFWFLLKNLKTDGVWETVVLNFLFFLVLPLFLFKEKLNGLFFKNNWSINFQVGALWLIFGLVVFNLDSFSFLKINYLSRMDWFLKDWGVIFFLNLILIPIILFSQEFFFRKFLIKNLKENFSIKVTLILQASFFVIFEMLFFEIFTWQFIVFNFILALILGVFYLQTKSIWYSFLVRWGLILILDGTVLYKIQQIKS
jgi:membrane protease YdiL (CAAX protease family)